MPSFRSPSKESCLKFLKRMQHILWLVKQSTIKIVLGQCTHFTKLTFNKVSQSRDHFVCAKQFLLYDHSLLIKLKQADLFIAHFHSQSKLLKIVQGYKYMQWKKNIVKEYLFKNQKFKIHYETTSHGTSHTLMK